MMWRDSRSSEGPLLNNLPRIPTFRKRLRPPDRIRNGNGMALPWAPFCRRRQPSLGFLWLVEQSLLFSDSDLPSPLLFLFSVVCRVCRTNRCQLLLIPTFVPPTCSFDPNSGVVLFVGPLLDTFLYALCIFSRIPHDHDRAFFLGP